MDIHCFGTGFLQQQQTTNFIENWKITNYITFPPANSLWTNRGGGSWRHITKQELYIDGLNNSEDTTIQFLFSFRESFERWNFSGKWISYTNKYQGREKIWLVGFYWSVENNFPTEFLNKIVTNDPRNTVIERNKLEKSLIKYVFCH